MPGFRWLLADSTRRLLSLAVVACGVPGVSAAQSRAPVGFSGAPSKAVVAPTTQFRFARPTPVQGGAPNPRLLPDISAVGDLIGDFSPDATTQEDGARFSIREVELAVQAAVDPSFRGDVFLGFSDAEGVHIEQAFMTATSLPWHLEMRLGRYLAPFGKQNTTHRHDLHTVDYSLVGQRFLGEEGLKETGLYLARSAAPFGFFQEFILTAADRLGEAPEDLVVEDATNNDLSDVACSARLRNY